MHKWLRVKGKYAKCNKSKDIYFDMKILCILKNETRNIHKLNILFFKAKCPICYPNPLRSYIQR